MQKVVKPPRAVRNSWTMQHESRNPAFRAAEDDAGGAHEVPMEDRSIDITGDSSEHASHDREADEVTAPNQASDAASPLAGESPMWPSQSSGPSWKSSIGNPPITKHILAMRSLQRLPSPPCRHVLLPH